MELSLYLHLLGVLLFASGVAVAGVAFESARRRADASEIALLLGISRIGVIMVAVGACLILIFGMALVQIGNFTLASGWLSAALGLFVLAMALGAIGGQRPKRARLLATELADRGAGLTPELRELLDGRLSRALNYLSLLLILGVLALMVFKP